MQKWTGILTIAAAGLAAITMRSDAQEPATTPSLVVAQAEETPATEEAPATEAPKTRLRGRLPNNYGQLLSEGTSGVPWDQRPIAGTGGLNGARLPEVQTVEATVYVTKTGEKYHRSTCRYLRKSKIPVSLAEAKKRYAPCKVCKPTQ